MLAAAACSSQTPEVVDPVGSSTTVTSSPSGTAVTSTTAPVDWQLSALDPCTWLSAESATQLGLSGEGQQFRALGLRPACLWTAPDRRLTITHHATEPFTARPLAPEARTEQVRVGRHDGRRVEAAGQCQFDLAVTDASSVSIEVTTTQPDAPHGDACPIAQQAAAILEPRLP
jgi:hypothetical protein